MVDTLADWWYVHALNDIPLEPAIVGRPSKAWYVHALNDIPLEHRESISLSKGMYMIKTTYLWNEINNERKEWKLHD